MGSIDNIRSHAKTEEAIRYPKFILSYYFLLLFLTVVPATMAAADVTTECPDEFTTGATIIKCLINTAAASRAHCEEKVSKVLFNFMSRNGQSWTLCTTPYLSRCTDNTMGKPGCASSSGDISTYQCSFVANENEHTGGSITCTPSCGSVPPLTTNTTEGCRKIKFLRGSASSFPAGTARVTFGLVIMIFIRLSLN